MRVTRALKPQDRAPHRWITVTTGKVLVVNASLGLHFRAGVTVACVLEPPQAGSAGQEIVVRLEWLAAVSVTLSPELRTVGTVALPSTLGSVYLLRMIYDDEARAWDVYGVPSLTSAYDPAGTAAAAIVTHVAQTDPHTQYLKESEAFAPKASGLATLVSGTVDVSSALVAAGSRIFLTPQETGTLNGRIRVSARSAGVSFTITSTDGADDAVIAWVLL